MTLAFTAGEGGPGVFEPGESVTRTQPAAGVVGNLAAALARASMARCSRSISLRTGAGVSTSIECCTTGNSKGTLPAAPRPAAAKKAAIPAPAIKAAIATARGRRTVRPTRERSALRLRHLSPATNFCSSDCMQQVMQPPLVRVLLLGQGALALSVLNTTRAICRLRQRIASRRVLPSACLRSSSSASEHRYNEVALEVGAGKWDSRRRLGDELTHGDS